MPHEVKVRIHKSYNCFGHRDHRDRRSDIHSSSAAQALGKITVYGIWGNYGTTFHFTTVVPLLNPNWKLSRKRCVRSKRPQSVVSVVSASNGNSRPGGGRFSVTVRRRKFKGTGHSRFGALISTWRADPMSFHGGVCSHSIDYRLDYLGLKRSEIREQSLRVSSMPLPVREENDGQTVARIAEHVGACESSVRE